MHFPARYLDGMTDTPAARLKKAREDAGYSSASAAAEALGVPLATYTQHENGRRGIPRDAAPQYARRFKVPEEWLLYGKGGALQSVERSAPSISMPVLLPSAAALKDMFVSMLEQIEIDPHEGGRADTLARIFPGALQGALLLQAEQGDEKLSIRAKRPRAGDVDPASP